MKATTPLNHHTQRLYIGPRLLSNCFRGYIKFFFNACDKLLIWILVYNILVLNFLENIYAYSSGPTNISGPKSVGTTQAHRKQDMSEVKGIPNRP